MRTGILMMLGFAAAADLRKRSIPVIPVIVFAAVLIGLRYLYFRQNIELTAILAGMIPGAFFFLISAVSRGAAGSGDALLILLLGLVIGFWDTGMICFLALTLCGLSGLGMMVMGKAGKKTQLPFVPFLLTAYVLLVAAGLLDLS